MPRRTGREGLHERVRESEPRKLQNSRARRRAADARDRAADAEGAPPAVAVGDFGSTCCWTDHNPVVIERVSPNGKTVWVRRVRFTVRKSHKWEPDQSLTLEDVVRSSIKPFGEPEAYRWTTRKGAGGFRSGESRLALGFRSYRDPHL